MPYPNANATFTPGTPQIPGAQPVSPAADQPTRATLLLTQAQPSNNPLAYVSPQAAIAAGLDAQGTYEAWVQALSQFSTVQDAVNGGIPAGVVTQLWAASRKAQAKGKRLSPQALLALGLAAAIVGAALVPWKGTA